MLVFLFVSGLLVGIISGMLGIGGGILITPILLYAPALLGLPNISMKAITGLTMVQGLVGSAAGYLAHRRYRIINKQLIYWMGPVIVVASFLGAHFSAYLEDAVLMALFAFMALAAAVLMLINGREKPLTGEAGKIDFNRALAVTLAAVVGFMGGLVGQGGSFILVPALINILGIPTKVAMGSNLGIVLLSSLAGLGGKISAGLVDPRLAISLMAGVIPGAQLGAFLSHRLHRKTIKRILAGVIILVSLQIWWTVLKPQVIAIFYTIPENLVFLYAVSIIGLVLGIINTSLLTWLSIHHIRRQKKVSQTIKNQNTSPSGEVPYFPD